MNAENPFADDKPVTKKPAAKKTATPKPKAEKPEVTEKPVEKADPKGKEAANHTVTETETVEQKTGGVSTEAEPDKTGTESTPDHTVSGVEGVNAPAAHAKPKKSQKKLSELEHEKLPLSAISGNVTGVVKQHNGVAVVELALVGWVGPAPLSVSADELDDIEAIIADLRKQANKA